MYRLRKFLISIFNTILLIYFIFFMDWFLDIFQMEWIGLLIILTTLRTRILSWMMTACYYLQDGTYTYSRILYKDRIYEYRNYSRIDRVKLKMLKQFPEIMFWTDYKHGMLPHGLDMGCRTKSWWKGVYPVTLIQLAVGYCWFMGYYSPYYNVIALGWGIAFVLGMSISWIDYDSKFSKLHFKLLIFRMNVADMLYYLSLGFTRRGGFFPIRIAFSLFMLIICVANYFGYLEIALEIIKKVGNEIWHLLLLVLPNRITEILK